jgi:hypothetical protein
LEQVPCAAGEQQERMTSLSPCPSTTTAASAFLTRKLLPPSIDVAALARVHLSASA